MVSRGLWRLLGASLGALLLLGMLNVAAFGASGGECTVEAAPRAAPAGSIFTFTGSGFKPTEMTLLKEGGDAIVHQISVETDDEWQVTVTSRAGDEGSWTATFWAADACTESASFQVTLRNTDLVSDLLTMTDGTRASLLMYLMVVGFGLSGGAFLARRLDASRKA